MTNVVPVGADFYRTIGGNLVLDSGLDIDKETNSHQGILFALQSETLIVFDENGNPIDSQTAIEEFKTKGKDFMANQVIQVNSANYGAVTIKVGDDSQLDGGDDQVLDAGRYTAQNMTAQAGNSVFESLENLRKMTET